MMKAILALGDGSCFEGESFGATTCRQGEVCFNTAMTGYQEILTDPSYSGQIVAMTYPEIGNTGVNPEDVESAKIQVAGFIVKNCCEKPSNWRNTGEKGTGPQTLSQYLKANNIPGIKGIDTRRLVRILREKGAQTGILATGNYNREEVILQTRKVPHMAGQDLASKVTTKKSYPWDEPEHPLAFKSLYPTRKSPRIAAIDFGIKFNILRKLKSLGAEIITLPAQATASEILAQKPDGIMLSNGPGDPEPVVSAIETIKQLIGRVPIFGICLGHQLLSIALGAKTFKLKFGHRGANHPIKYLPTGEVAITSQNHGFAVAPDSINTKLLEVTHINLNDKTIAGLRHRHFPVFSVQYHPEASPGPHDSESLFSEFMTAVMAFWESHQPEK